MKAIIDPADDILYKSFYIYGLEKLLGRENVCFDGSKFSSLSHQSRNSKSLRFIIDDGKHQRRYMISCDDSFQIIPELFDWCDVYGSVNTNFEKTPAEFHPKLVSLCPSFAVCCWSMSNTIFNAITSLSQRGASVRKHFGKYKRLLQRQSYADYVAGTVEKGYLFLCSTLWTNNEWNRNDETVNLARARFIRACKSIKDLNFEGGFVPSKTSSNELFKDCLCESYSTREWMKKTRKSVCVFNTPAYWQCHGWKLGEYMALGKAIVSTPLSNDLPAPLLHGEHIHIVENDEEAMSDAIKYIVSHPEYRQRLEKNIQTYWQKYGTPEASLHLLGL